MSGGRRAHTPRTVTARVMVILGTFVSGRPVMGLQEISRRTGLPLSTTHRLLTELVDWGALARIGDCSYQVGPLVTALAAATRTDGDRPVGAAPAHRPSPESAGSGTQP